MKPTIKFIHYYFPKLARLVVLHHRRTIRFLPQSRREVRVNGPVFIWRKWMYSVSPSGRIDPIRKEGGVFYCPAFHEESEGETMGEEAERKLLRIS